MTKFAAKNGHLDCLRYAHEHGCIIDIMAAEYAENNGHLDCLQYVRDHESITEIQWSSV